jgi:hypothetical protein
MILIINSIPLQRWFHQKIQSPKYNTGSPIKLFDLQIFENITPKIRNIAAPTLDA